MENGIDLLRYNGNQTNIVVPSIIDGKNVVSLNSTFDGFEELKSVVIPKGVTSIVGAFYGCEGLEKVLLPEGIEDITYAFNSCFSLKNIKIPSTVKNFSWAFGGTAIEKFIFPYEAENIAYTFFGNEQLKSVFIPKSVTDLSEAFADCEALESVVLEDGLKKIDDYAFFNCVSLLEITIPESVLEFGNKSVGFMDSTGYTIKGAHVIPGFKIRGVAGSMAEKYAKENNIEFIAL